MKTLKPLKLKTRPVTKQDITNFFKTLRKHGFFARQGYWCCNSCGCAALEQDMKPKHTKWVFYHKQDADAFEDPDYGYGPATALTRPLYLTFGDLKGNKNVTERIGREIDRIAGNCGLAVDWDGTAYTRIAILPEKVAL